MGLKSHLKSLLVPSPSTSTQEYPHFIILPLYIYPDPGCWEPLYKTLSAYPSLPITIIINPNSGPGPGPAPDTEYIAGIAKLNSYANTTLLGYVHCITTQRPITALKADIDTYASWATYRTHDIHVAGIFFDEAPNDYLPSTYSYMRNAATYARKTIPLPSPIVVFNPGTVVDNRFFALADYINVFENYAREYSCGSIQNVPGTVKRYSMFMIHHFAGNKTDLEKVLGEVMDIRKGVSGVFVSTEEYHSWGSCWEEFCMLMERYCR